MSELAMSEWSPNQVIQGRYRLKSLLGKGGMGSVWVAMHEQLHSEVAVKRLDSSIATNEEALARFNREAQALAALRSPNVVQVFDYGIDDGVAFIAMEKLQGESLGDRIKRLGRLPVDDTVRFLGEVLRAIGKAHAAGIIHRDLKPDNIFICEDDPEFAKVLDFGVAKVSGTSQSGVSSQTRTGAVIGTPFYMSPEQARGQQIDARSDIWSLGVIAFECLTGQLPFAGDSFGDILVAICTEAPLKPSLVGSVPQGFDEWFARATDRDRERRFQSAREMWTDLARLVGTPMTTRTATLVERFDESVVGVAGTNRTMEVPGALTTSRGAATYSTVNHDAAVTTRHRRNMATLVAALGTLTLALAAGGFALYRSGQERSASAPTAQSALATSGLGAAHATTGAAMPATNQPSTTAIVAATAPYVNVTPVSASSAEVAAQQGGASTRQSTARRQALPPRESAVRPRPATQRAAPATRDDDNVRGLIRSF